MNRETVEFWTRHDWSGPERNDSFAIATVKDDRDLARLGYVIDRLRAVGAKQIGRFWKYTVPVQRVIS